MSKRISQYPELVTLDGSEETVLAVRGKNYRVKLRGLSGLFPTPTKEALGLGLVDNTPDLQKPISVEVAQALLDKADKRHDHSKADIEDLVADLAAITSTLNGLSTSVGTLTSTVDSFSASIASIVDAQNLINLHDLEQTADISNLKSRMSDIESSNTTLLTQFATIVNDMQIVNLAVSGLSSQVTALAELVAANAPTAVFIGDPEW